MSSLSELLRAQQEEESGTLDYYSYWWADPDAPRVHKISAFRHLDVGAVSGSSAPWWTTTISTSRYSRAS